MRFSFVFFVALTMIVIPSLVANPQITEDPALNRVNPPGRQPRLGFQIDELILYDDVRKADSRIEFDSDTKFASDASRVFGTFKPANRPFSGEAAKSAANRLISLLDKKQKSRALHKLGSSERSKWTNLPAPRNAGGIRLGDLKEEQLEAVCELLSRLLSPQGYEKMRLLMLGDDQLLRNGRRRPGFGTEDFSLVLFGTPSTEALWSVQLDGHHIGLNVAVFGEQITIAPSFIGAQPVSYKLGGQDVNPMNTEIKAAFLLANELTEEQFKKALVGNRRGRIATGPGNDGKLPKKNGIACSELNEQQRSHLMTLVWAWVGNMPKQHAVKRMLEIEKDFNQTYFAWNGSRKSGSDVSYTIFGPSLIIEFAYQDLGGVPQNHLHTQFRNPKNDYGKRFESK